VFVFHAGDQSAADTTQQSYIDQQIRQMIDMEDVSVVADLRSHNQGQSHKFEYFWSECEKFINEDIGRAVDDRRHGSVTHMARAISIRDLKEQVCTFFSSHILALSHNADLLYMKFYK
jgi:hypothetical protein